MNRLILSGTILGATLVLAAGCSTHNNASLVQAQADYLALRQDPQVTTNAPVALHEAALALNRAERSWDEHRNQAEVDHLAYIAEQRIAIARKAAQEKIAQDEAQRLAQERDRVVLEARTREAERARQQAEASARQAEEARRLAQTRALEAQQAQLGEQARVREAELARLESEKRAREAEAARQQADQERQKAEARAERIRVLEQQLTEFKARETERGLELTLSGVLFEFDKASLKPGALHGLAPLVEFLKANPDREVVLEGHTDSIGNNEYNVRLSQHRAEAVRDYLAQNGIDARRITARGLGEQYPVASNNSEAGRLQNRRVEIIISNERTAGTTSSQRVINQRSVSSEVR